MKTLILLTLNLSLFSCANLYKEKSFITEMTGDLRGDCGQASAQNNFFLKTERSEIHISLPVNYDYWWTGPVIIPMIPLNKERRDPSFINVTLSASEGILDREILMNSKIFIKNEVDPVKPLTVVFSRNKESEFHTIQFDSPKLVDIKNFRLKLDDTLLKEPLNFRLATDVHYVPILPVITGKCVTE